MKPHSQLELSDRNGTLKKLRPTRMMLLTEEINQIKRELEEVNDEDLVRTIRDLLEYAKKKSARDKLLPMTVEEFRQRAEESKQAIGERRVTSIEAVEHEASQW